MATPSSRRALRRWHPLWWLPCAVVLMLAWVNGTMPDDDPICPAGVDGPQFACWLEQHPEQFAPDDCFARAGDGQCTGGTEAEVAPDAP